MAASLEAVLATAKFSDAVCAKVLDACDSLDDLMEASEQDVDTLLLEGIKVLPAKRFKRWLKELREQKEEEAMSAPPKPTSTQEPARPLVPAEEGDEDGGSDGRGGRPRPEKEGPAEGDAVAESTNAMVTRGVKKLMAKFESLAEIRDEPWELWHSRAIAWARRAGEWCFGYEEEPAQEACRPEVAVAAVEGAVMALLRLRPRRVYDLTHYLVTRSKVEQRLREDATLSIEARTALAHLATVFEAVEKDPLFAEFGRADEARRAKRHLVRAVRLDPANDPKHVSYLLMSQSLQQFMEDRVGVLWENDFDGNGKVQGTYALLDLPDTLGNVADVVARELERVAPRLGGAAVYVAVALFKRADPDQRAILAPTISKNLEPAARRIADSGKPERANFVLDLLDAWRRELDGYPEILEAVVASLAILRGKRQRSVSSDDDHISKRSRPAATGTLYWIASNHAFVLQDDNRFPPTITAMSLRLPPKIAEGDRVSYYRTFRRSGNDLAEDVTRLDDQTPFVRYPRSSFRRFRGLVVQFDPFKLTGFIECSHDNRKIFFHPTEFCAPVPVKTKLRVTFAVSEFRSRPCAVDVCLDQRHPSAKVAKHLSSPSS